MKRIAATLSAASLLAGAATAAPRVGQPAPDFSARTAEGQTVSLSDYEGKKVVLEWTNNECPFVKKHYDSGNMQALQRRATADGTVWLSVISSAPGKQGHVSGDRATELSAERKAAPTAILLDEDGEVGQLYAAKTTPHMFVIDETGTLRYAGAIDTIPSADIDDIPRAENYVSAALASLRNDQRVVTTQTQPYGCSVKY
ncbi:thioredoxin family protein [Parvularcula dongshanensis]|uniref:Peroxiredoxin n=1 Tax=Parvularcula dongshanensis TaxID=1173995 RepID=A0A840I2Q4_9PROT|nr:thioredoxin family protein [Parvularcula dongshanensis]MBB4658561.1 peroxiredoxin [Parvularcula dongshanensis]